MTASPGNGRDKSDNSNTHKSILGSSIRESSRSSALGLWTLITFVTVSLLVNKPTLKLGEFDCVKSIGNTAIRKFAVR